MNEMKSVFKFGRKQWQSWPLATRCMALSVKPLSFYFGVRRNLAINVFELNIHECDKSKKCISFLL